METMNTKRKKIVWFVVWALAVPVFALSQISFWQTSMPVALAEDSISDIDETAEDIDDTEDEIEKVEKERAKLLQKDGQIQSAISSTQYSINKTQAMLLETERTISRKEAEITNLNDQIKLHEGMLRNFLQEIYYIKNQPLLEVALAEKNFTDMFSNANHLVTLEDKIIEVSHKLSETKGQVEQDKIELADVKEQHEETLSQKLDQKQDLLEDRSEVQAAIQSKEATLSQLKSELNKLKQRYSAALGKSVSTDDIIEAAEFAAKATKMSKSFLLGVLVQESNKGQNVGGCNYKTSRMPATQLTAFKKINKELGYDYKKQKVSCPPSKYKGTGGAMGVPQFMPTTWLGYKSRIAALSGNNPPDPWDLVDGVVAMASKLSNDGASKKTRFAEAKSYCVYLAGGNWGYYCFGTDKYKKDYSDINCSGSSIRNYGEKVLCLKDNYEKYY